MNGQLIWLAVTAATAFALVGLVASGVRRSQRQPVELYNPQVLRSVGPRTDIERQILGEQEIQSDVDQETGWRMVTGRLERPESRSEELRA